MKFKYAYSSAEFNKIVVKNTNPMVVADIEYIIHSFVKKVGNGGRPDIAKSTTILLL